MKFPGRSEIIKTVQTSLGIAADGVDGPTTWNRIRSALASPAATVTDQITDSITTLLPSGLSDRAMKLILDHEVGGGEGYYNKALKKPCYPGGASGVTIGIGYDLGYNTLSQFTADWKAVLDPETFKRLSSHLGKKGNAAKAAIPSVSDIIIPWSAALIVFKSNTLPRFINETRKAFPGADQLHPDTFGALVSLVFNRGGSVSGATRVEMLNIKNAIGTRPKNSQLYQYIADQIISMKRLWIGKGLDGLLRRRNEEADLVRKSK